MVDIGKRYNNWNTIYNKWINIPGTIDPIPNKGPWFLNCILKVQSTVQLAMIERRVQHNQFHPVISWGKQLGD